MLVLVKKCTTCCQVYPATVDYFYYEKRGKYGLRSKCKACFYEQSKVYKATPKSRAQQREASRLYYSQNRSLYAAKWKKYYQEHKEHLKAKDREYRKRNRERARVLDRKRREDPTYRMASNMSRAIRQSLKQRGRVKPTRWEHLVGYTREDLKRHLAKRFQPGMSWDNYGEWHIDHIIPVSVFNYSKETHQDFQRCWALDNLQPLWAHDNMTKHAVLSKPFQPSLAM